MLSEEKSRQSDERLNADGGPTERVGREGELFLEYIRCHDRTILKRSFSRIPLQVFQPIGPDGDRCAYHQILNPCGGLVGGDRLTIEARLGEGAHVLLTTPSATRVYRTGGEGAVQTTSIEVGPDAVLEWMPDTVIPFAGSRFEQVLEIGLDSRATLFLWDAFASGRVARKERWAFARFKNEIRISTSEKDRVLERYDLDPKRMHLASPALAGDWDYFASFYVISGRPVDWQALSEKMSPVLDPWPDRILGGVSSLSVPGVVMRLAAKTAVDLSAAQAALWKKARRDLLGLDPLQMRKY